jgi:hypothetical protein
MSHILAEEGNRVGSSEDQKSGSEEGSQFSSLGHFRCFQNEDSLNFQPLHHRWCFQNDGTEQFQKGELCLTGTATTDDGSTNHIEIGNCETDRLYFWL